MIYLVCFELRLICHKDIIFSIWREKMKRSVSILWQQATLLLAHTRHSNALKTCVVQINILLFKSQKQYDGTQ